MARVFSLALVLLLMTVPRAASPASPTVQSDWSGGPASGGPVATWEAGFAASEGVSWLALPGQMALASTPVTTPVAEPISRAFGSAYGLRVVDLDGDHRQDLVATTDAVGVVVAWLNRGGAPASWRQVTITEDFAGGTSIHPADVDGDGDLDLVGAAQTPGHRIAWWRNDGDVWTGFVVDDRFPVACNLDVADLDGDGDPDVVSTSWAAGELAWWQNEGGDPVAWTKHRLLTVFLGAHSAEVGDFDGDGDLDLVATAANAGRVTVLSNDGGAPPNFSAVDLSTSNDGVRHAVFADLDGDGRPDVIAVGADGQVTWWRNTAADPATWQRHTIATDVRGGHWTAVADLDGDGRRDVVVASWLRNAIFWLRQTGADEWQQLVVADGLADPLTAVVFDVDRDGDLDVAGASHGDGAFDWWRITEFVAAGWLEGSVLDRGHDTPERFQVEWSAITPPGTRLQVAVRTADTPDGFGAWSAAAVAPFELVAGRYVQYRLELESDDPAASPLVREVRLVAAGAGLQRDPRRAAVLD